MIRPQVALTTIAEAMVAANTSPAVVTTCQYRPSRGSCRCLCVMPILPSSADEQQVVIGSDRQQHDHGHRQHHPIFAAECQGMYCQSSTGHPERRTQDNATITHDNQGGNQGCADDEHDDEDQAQGCNPGDPQIWVEPLANPSRSRPRLPNCRSAHAFAGRPLEAPSADHAILAIHLLAGRIAIVRNDESEPTFPSGKGINVLARLKSALSRLPGGRKNGVVVLAASKALYKGGCIGVAVLFTGAPPWCCAAPGQRPHLFRIQSCCGIILRSSAAGARPAWSMSLGRSAVLSTNSSVVQCIKMDLSAQQPEC